MNVNTCIKCGSTERYSHGRCKACARSRAARYRKANPERTAASVVAWVKKNPERKAETFKAYYSNNKKRFHAQSAAWARAHPEVRAIYEQNRRAKKRVNGGKLSKGLAARLLFLQRGKCACCRCDLSKAKYHLDHMMPVSAGGANEDFNIQLLCPPCNFDKKAKHPVDFMQERGFLL